MKRLLARIARALGFRANGPTPNAAAYTAGSIVSASTASPSFSPPKVPEKPSPQSDELWKRLEAPPEASDGQMAAVESCLALMAHQPGTWPDKAGVLNLAKLRMVFAYHGLSLEDMPTDDWLQYCMNDAVWLNLLLDAASEKRTQRKAKETIDRVASAIVKETKE